MADNVPTSSTDPVPPSTAAPPDATDVAGTGSASPTKKPVATFVVGKRKRKKRRGIRKRGQDDDDDDGEGGGGGGSGGGGGGGAGADDGVVVKPVGPSASRRRLNTFGTASGKPKRDIMAELQIKSSRDAAPVKYAGEGATAANTLESADGGVQVKKGNKFTGTGPLRAPTNLRSTSRFDYAPDICKDYKETGSCGYGDSCIYLHDRGDYKAGWQIEKEWQEKQKRAAEALARGEAGSDSDDDDKYVIDSDEDDMPFACYICRETFTNPVETLCKHYFCRQCAIKRYGKNSTCAVCGKQTYGTFNVATKLVEKMKKDDAAAAAAAAEDAEDSDAEGGGGGAANFSSGGTRSGFVPVNT